MMEVTALVFILMSFLQIASASTIYYFFGTIGAIAIAVSAISSFFYGLRLGKSKAEDHRLKPFKEAAEGWEKRSEQLETELHYHTEETARLRSQYEEMRSKYDQLVIDYVKLSQTNQRQQGEIDHLTADVQALSEFKQTLQVLITGLQKG